MYKRPNPGDIVTVATRYHSNLLNKEFDTNVYENRQVLEPYPWMSADEFRIPCTDNQFVDEHIINMKNVILFDIMGRDKEMTEQGVHYVDVPGSKGNVYSVRIENGVATKCECKGFQFRGRCRHLAEGLEIFRGLLTEG